MTYILLWSMLYHFRGTRHASIDQSKHLVISTPLCWSINITASLIYMIHDSSGICSVRKIRPGIQLDSFSSCRTKSWPCFALSLFCVACSSFLANVAVERNVTEASHCHPQTPNTVPSCIHMQYPRRPPQACRLKGESKRNTQRSVRVTKLATTQKKRCPCHMKEEEKLNTYTLPLISSFFFLVSFMSCIYKHLEIKAIANSTYSIWQRLQARRSRSLKTTLMKKNGNLVRPSLGCTQHRDAS